MDRKPKAIKHNLDSISDATQRLEKNPRDVPALMDRADAFMEQRNAESALRDIEHSLEIALMEPRLEGEIRGVLLARLYTMQSRALAGLGDWATALLAIEQAIREKANSVDAIVQRGRIRRESSDLQGALQDFDHALALDKYSTIAYIGRGMTRYKMQDYQGAIADYDRAISLDKTRAVAWSNRGNAYFALQDYQKAEQDCRTALKLDPRLIRAYEIVSHIYRQQGRHSEAMHIVIEGLRYQPYETRLLVQAARICIDQERLPKALSIANRVLQQSTDHSEAYALRGQIHGRLGSYAAAIEDLQRATELEPTEVENYFNLALAYLHSRNLAAAIGSLEHVLKLDQNDDEARSLYERLIRDQEVQHMGKKVSDKLSDRAHSKAEVYCAQGKYEAALKEWEQEIATAREARDSYKEAYLLILAGSYYVKIGQRKKGEKRIRKGLKLAQKSGYHREIAQAHVELAQVAFTQQRWKQAGKHFSHVLAIGRKISSKHYEHLGLGNLGAVYRQMGRMEEGVKLVEQARDIAHEIGDKVNEAAYCKNLGRFYLNFVVSKNPLHTRYAYDALEMLERAQRLDQEMGIGPDMELEELVHGIRRILHR